VARPFRCRIPVRFGDIDQAGVAYYPTLLSHCHAAFEEFFAGALGRTYPKVVMEDKIGFPTVHLEADFREPLRYGDLLTMEVSVAKLGERSVVFRYRAFRKGSRQAAFEILGTTACVDLKRFKSVPVPRWLRERLKRYLRPA